MKHVSYTTTTGTWPEDDSWEMFPNQHGFVDLNFRFDEDTNKLMLVVYQASDCGRQTNVTDPETWRVFDLVERTSS
jgi:hypothetical protein